MTEKDIMQERDASKGKCEENLKKKISFIRKREEKHDIHKNGTTRLGLLCVALIGACPIRVCSRRARDT